MRRVSLWVEAKIFGLRYGVTQEKSNYQSFGQLLSITQTQLLVAIGFASLLQYIDPLREHIIAEINQLFTRLGIVCELRVSGLPTSSEILQVRRELHYGTMSFAKASDRVSV